MKDIYLFAFYKLPLYAECLKNIVAAILMEDFYLFSYKLRAVTATLFHILR